MSIKKIWLVLPLVFLIACTPVLSTSTSSLDTENLEAPIVVEEVVPEVEREKVISPYSLEALASRTYGEGEFRIEYPWHEKEEFTRYYITYDSDGLNIHGYVNIPRGKGPFPVVIALHGYIPSYRYDTLDYSTRYADSIARKGYIVLHPNMRNFPPSDSPGRERDYLAGYTADVMNLLAYVEEMAGQEGIFENADLSRMGIWGHSLGGGIALRVANLVPEIKAAVLYAAVSQRYNNNTAGVQSYDLEATDAAFSVHHGKLDDTIYANSSIALCADLEEAGREHECYFYEDGEHTFLRMGDNDPLFIQRTVDFFAKYVQGE